jgi:hypothetical protein
MRMFPGLGFIATASYGFISSVMEAMAVEKLTLPRSGGHTIRRGKRKPPRHGQKLKSCRIKVGRRVRRKHRRAAR